MTIDPPGYERMMDAASKYRKGRHCEQYIVQQAQAAGCMAWRTAGSKGEGGIDVLVASLDTGMIGLNIKRGQWAPPAERIAMRHLPSFGILPVLVRFELRHTGKAIALLPMFRACDDGLQSFITPVAPWTADWLAL